MKDQTVAISPARPGGRRTRIWRNVKLIWLILILFAAWRHSDEISGWMALLLSALIFAGGVVLLVIYIRWPIYLYRLPNGVRPHRLLTFNARGMRYLDRWGERWAIPWHAITTVMAARDEDYEFGDWYFTTWLILHDGKTTELDDKAADHQRLLSAFWNYLPGFRLEDAMHACESNEYSRTTCYSRAGTSA